MKFTINSLAICLARARIANPRQRGDIAVAKKIHDKFPKASFNNYTKTFGFTPYDQNTIPGAVIMLEEVEIK
ncbi:MAG: hypothetical protein KJ578_09205 [Bacteroidetes bacterium]|nr:hypothetical protein [Bacteroidota bacterium]MBU1580510.1 hypothetical protein [Bacteroidota bacterium]MBU2466987.1 hypothetical protein [Bacteroidota bacterium]MBU2557939.1 hypothetical protein [Bacteroidota bacterium]